MTKSLLAFALLLAGVSAALPATAASGRKMVGVVENWSEGQMVGQFDLEVGGGDTAHFQIDLQRTLIDGTLAAKWAGDAPSPFGTYDHPIRKCVRVEYYVANGSRVAKTVTILGNPRASAYPCS